MTAPPPAEFLRAVWEITLRCDLACNHCGSRAGKAREDELSTSEALDVVGQLAEVGCQEVSLIGGEAYLREDWTEIAAAIVASGMLCNMVTGGRGVTPGRARAAKEAGIDSVSVSLDGLEEAHNRQRGTSDSFARALEAVDNLRAAGVATSANTQVNRVSFPDLDGLLDLLVSKDLFAWQVQLTVPMGRAADTWEWLLQPDDLLEVIPTLARLKRSGAARGVDLQPGNNVGYFGPHEHVLRSPRPDEAAAHYDGCGLGISTLGLEADGKLKGCPSLPSSAYTGGNVRERSIRQIREESSELRLMRDGAKELWGTCASCYYAEVCQAGCTWTSHVFFGKPGNNPYCHHRALELERDGKRERLIRAAPAPGAPFDFGRFELRVESISTDKPSLQTGLDALLAADPLPTPAGGKGLPVV